MGVWLYSWLYFVLFVIGLKISHHFLIQSEVNTTTLMNFFPRFCRLRVFVSSFDWFIRLSVSLVIGWSDYTVLWFCFYNTQLKTTLRVVIENVKAEYFW